MLMVLLSLPLLKMPLQALKPATPRPRLIPCGQPGQPGRRSRRWPRQASPQGLRAGSRALAARAAPVASCGRQGLGKGRPWPAVGPADRAPVPAALPPDPLWPSHPATPRPCPSRPPAPLGFPAGGHRLTRSGLVPPSRDRLSPAAPVLALSPAGTGNAGAGCGVPPPREQRAAQRSLSPLRRRPSHLPRAAAASAFICDPETAATARDTPARRGRGGSGRNRGGRRGREPPASPGHPPAHGAPAAQWCP